MFEIKNNTPFQADIAVLHDKEGIDHVIAMAKATYTFSMDNKVSIANEQLPVQKGDEYFGDPDSSSIKYGSEIALLKTGTDIGLIGHAYSLKKGVTRIDAMLKVGPTKKIVRVYGDRHWKYNMGMILMTNPFPFNKMPIIYERAFGGEDKTHVMKKNHAVEEQNPVGIGFRVNKSKESLEGHPLPNIEDPFNEIKSWQDKPKPVGFGFIAPSWLPRKNYAGTYDKKWETDKMPFLPDDFDNRFFNTAHSDLITQGYLKGNEDVEMYNLHPQRMGVKFRLPGGRIDVTFNIQGKNIKTHANLDTLFIEPDKNHFTLLWRASTKCLKKVLQINRVLFEYKV